MKRRIVLPLVPLLTMAALLSWSSKPSAGAVAVMTCEEHHDACRAFAWESYYTSCLILDDGEITGYYSCECKASRKYQQCMTYAGCSQKGYGYLQEISSSGMAHCFNPQ